MGWWGLGSWDFSSENSAPLATSVYIILKISSISKPLFNHHTIHRHTHIIKSNTYHAIVINNLKNKGARKQQNFSEACGRKHLMHICYYKQSKYYNNNFYCRINSLCFAMFGLAFAERSSFLVYLLFQKKKMETKNTISRENRAEYHNAYWYIWRRDETRRETENLFFLFISSSWWGPTARYHSRDRRKRENDPFRPSDKAFPFGRDLLVSCPLRTSLLTVSVFRSR